MEEIKKSYNAFKMWGSYVVFGILILIILLNLISGCFDFYQMFNLGGPNCSGIFFMLAVVLAIPMLPVLLLTLNPILAILFYVVFGFLLGWAIHSLVRRLRK